MGRNPRWLAQMFIKQVNWISPELVDKSTARTKQGLPVKVNCEIARQPQRHWCSGSKKNCLDQNDVHIVLETPEFGVAHRQAGVIYSSENERLVLGGG